MTIWLRPIQLKNWYMYVKGPLSFIIKNDQSILVFSFVNFLHILTKWKCWRPIFEFYWNWLRIYVFLFDINNPCINKIHFLRSFLWYMIECTRLKLLWFSLFLTFYKYGRSCLIKTQIKSICIKMYVLSYKF